MISKTIVKLTLAFPYIFDKILSIFYRKTMKCCGPKVYLRPSSSDFKGLQNLSVGGAQAFQKVLLSIAQRLRAQ